MLSRNSAIHDLLDDVVLALNATIGKLVKSVSRREADMKKKRFTEQKQIPVGLLKEAAAPLLIL